MTSNNIIVFSDSELAIDCHRFFTKYGFEVASFVLAKTTDKKLFDVPAFQLDEMDDKQLVDLHCPIIIASSNPAFISYVRRKLDSLMTEKPLIFEEPLIYSAWLEQLVDALSFNRTSTPNEYVEHLLVTHPAGLGDGRNAVEALAKYLSQKIKQDIDASQKTLAVYYPSRAYRTNLGSEAMYDRIRQQGYNVIFLFGVLCDDEFEKREFSYYAGHDIVGSLDFVDVFVIPTVMLGLPKRARKVLFVHDIYDSPFGAAEFPRPSETGEYPRESAFLDELDYMLIPCRALVGENTIHPLLRKKPLCKIPGGYIKLDHNIRYFEQCKLPTDSIIYAPTVMDDHFAEYVSVPKYGRKIVEALLEGFADYKIIFRPHPHTLQTEDVTKIAEHFSRDKRFVFDSNASFYNDNYCRSAVMVTDMSGTAFTYAFMTLRPVVFFSHREQDVAKAFDNVKYFEDRERIGYIATNIDELKEQVARALENTKRFARNSRRFRDETVFNLGRAEDYFAENFHCIAEGVKHKDWQYVVAPSSQSEARLLGSLHADIEQYIEKISSLDKVLEEQRAAIRKTKKLANDKSIQIDDLRREAQEKNDDIAGLKVNIEEKNNVIAELKVNIEQKDNDVTGLRAGIEQKNDDIAALRADIKKKNDDITGLKVNIEQKNRAIDGLQKLAEQKERDNRRLGDVLGERDENIRNLQRELEEIGSTWWFRLFSWLRKHLTTGKNTDKEKPAKKTQP